MAGLRGAHGSQTAVGTRLAWRPSRAPPRGHNRGVCGTFFSHFLTFGLIIVLHAAHDVLRQPIGCLQLASASFDVLREYFVLLHAAHVFSTRVYSIFSSCLLYTIYRIRFPDP